jgi:hypothetical protein
MSPDGLIETLPLAANNGDSAAEPITDEVRIWAWGELLEAVPDAIIGVDEGGRILVANTRAQEMFGYDEHELLGASVDMLVPEGVRSHHQTVRTQYNDDPGPRRLHARPGMFGQRADGSLFDIEVSLAPLMTEHGRLIIAAVRDIGALLAAKEAEQQSRLEAERERSSARAERARRLESLGLLAGGVAHDFNNLLAVIINYTALVEKQLGAGSGLIDDDAAAVARDDLREVRQAGERAAALTRELLTFSRGEQREGCATSDVAAMVRGTVALLERSVGKGIHLELDVPDEELAVRIDASRFEQVLFNLVINARDAMPRGGAIRIEADIADIDAAYAASRPGLAPGCHVRLSVSDEGSGMSPETVASAFDPFFTTKEAGEGSGLGLSTVYGIVREAGGDTKIYSEPDVGTTVTVTLPCATGEHSAVAKAARCSVHASTGLTVLLAEDEEPLRRAAARMLRDAGYEVVEAPDGATALALATDGAHSIDLVLTDVTMPAMTGTELAAQLRSERPDLPLLMMSGYASRNGPAGRSAIESHYRILAKPFGEADLLTAIAETIGDA